MVLMRNRQPTKPRSIPFLFEALFLGVCVIVSWNTVSFLKNYNDRYLEPTPPTEQQFTGIKPFDCKNLLSNIHRNDYPIKDPNDGQVFSRLTTLDPPFYVSLHKKEYDAPRFDILKNGQYYEKVLTEAFRKVLLEDETLKHPNSRVLDVGGNIGWFTHLSASLGYHVDVFEPNVMNGIRICQSIKFNEWSSSVDEQSLLHKSAHQGKSSINFYNNGVGEKEDKLELYVSAWNNPGTGSFVRKGWAGNATATVQVIPLDQFAEDKGWFKNRPLIPILKVDVEGFEPQVFRGAARLVKSGMIQNIFMEASPNDDTSDLIAMYTEIMESGYHLHAIGAWLGPDNLYEKPNASTNETIDYIVKKVIPSIDGSVNIWWKRNK